MFILQLEDKKGGAELEMNNDYITLNKRLELKMKKLSVGVDAKVGVTTAGGCAPCAQEVLGRRSTMLRGGEEGVQLPRVHMQFSSLTG